GGDAGGPVQILLFHERQEDSPPPPTGVEAGGLVGRREGAAEVATAVQGQAELLEVVGTFQAGCPPPGLLHRRQQEADQDGNDGDDDEQLDQREADPTCKADHGSLSDGVRRQVRVCWRCSPNALRLYRPVGRPAKSLSLVLSARVSVSQVGG